MGGAEVDALPDLEAPPPPAKPVCGHTGGIRWGEVGVRLERRGHARWALAARPRGIAARREWRKGRRHNS